MPVPSIPSDDAPPDRAAKLREIALALGLLAALLCVGWLWMRSAARAAQKHRAAAQAPQHTNHLADSTSPYLLQHAHNPVDWYPWGDEALQRAKRENKPIFLSVGDSACHWCHVMEK